MSGIAAAIDTRRPGVGALLHAAMGAMTHYDWYRAGEWGDDTDRAAVGQLAAGVFNAEPQPLWSRDGNLALWFCGELYYTGELRAELERRGALVLGESHAELALCAYETLGESFAGLLEGAFLAAIWHVRERRLVVANDRFGLYPHYYLHAHGRLIVAPEVKAILEDPAVRPEIDRVALAEYVRFQFLLGDKTFFQGIKLLPAATLLRYDAGDDTLHTREYWDMASIPERAPDFDEAAEEAGRLLQRAVRERAGGPGRLGMFLSGGLDARAMLGMLEPERRRGLPTLTYGPADCRDVVYAGQIARRMGTDHHWFPLNDGRWVAEYAPRHLELTEGFHSWIHSHGISILPRARELMDVNLSGFAGDELDWPDPLLVEAPDENAFLARIDHLLTQETTWPSLAEAEARLLLGPDMAGVAFDSMRQELGRYGQLSFRQRAAMLSRQHVDRRLYQYYVVTNRSHLEMRFPFCDYRYCDFIYSLPVAMLAQRRLRKAVIQRTAPALARVPYDKTGLPLSDHALSGNWHRVKKAVSSRLSKRWPHLFPQYATLYADYEGWLRAELREWGEGLLLSDETLTRGIFDEAMVRSLWLRLQSGAEPNVIGKLAPLMTYEMMLRRFVAGGERVPDAVPPEQSR